jgi:short-subunit dehydrogenase
MKKILIIGATGRRQDLLDSLHAEYPDQILTANTDATADDARTQMTALTKQMGGLDILIFNAGWGDLSNNLDWNIDKPIVDINVNAFLTAVHFGWDYFIRQGSGHLVTVSSIAGNRGNRHSPAYSAAKSFQSTYFEGLYIKARRMKIPLHVTDIQPGFVDTKMAKGPQFWVAPVVDHRTAPPLDTRLGLLPDWIEHRTWHFNCRQTDMKKRNVIALAALTAIAAGATIYLLQKKKRDRRKAFIANAGYETAYDVHYPIRYGRSKGKAAKN